jgi:hypothetical protein
MHIRTLFKILSLLILFSVSNSNSQELSGIPGAFVDIGYGVRPMGLGGAFVGLADDPNAVVWNPAGISMQSNPGVSLMYAKQLNLIPYSYISISFPFMEKFGAGAGVIYSGDEALSEITAIASFSYIVFTDFSIGANLKFHQASFGNNKDGGIGQVKGSATGGGTDFSILWKPTTKISLGVLLRDVAGTIKWESKTKEKYKTKGSYNEDIPANLIFGLAYSPSSNLNIALDYNKSIYSDVTDKFSIGMEREFFDAVTPRIGLSQNIGTTDVNRKYFIGLSLAPKFSKSPFIVSLDISYLINPIINNTLRLGLNLVW